MTTTYWVPTTSNAPTPLPVSLGGTGSATAGPLSEPIPADFAWQAWSADPGLLGATAAPVAGQIQLVMVILRATQTITNILTAVSTAGATLTAGQNFLGIYDSTGTLRGVTADQTTPWGSVGFKSAALTTAITNAAAGVYYVAFLSNGTTPPTFRASTPNAALANGSAVGAALRFSTNLGAQTTLPGSITLANNATGGIPASVVLS